jgi:hypothetical protein
MADMERAEGSNIARETAVFMAVGRFRRTSLNLRGTACLAMVPNRRRQACSGSFLSQRFALKRPAVLKASARNGPYHAAEEKAKRSFRYVIHDESIDVSVLADHVHHRRRPFGHAVPALRFATL